MSNDLDAPVSQVAPVRPRRRLGVPALGLLAAALSTLVTCFGIAAVTPPLGTADETGHLDYAYEVWHGHLPEFFRGVVVHFPMGVAIPPVQWESQHPPLFYLLASPIAGPLLAHHYVLADLGVRLLNSVIAAITVLALAWAAGLLGARDTPSWRLTVAAVAGTVGPLIYTGGSGYGDPLNALWCVLGLGMAVLILRRGPSLRRILVAALVSAAGTLTNAEYVFPFVLLLAAIALSVLLHDRSAALRRIVRAAVAAAIPVVAAVVVSGWFYLHNKHVSGNFQGSEPAYAIDHLHRHRLTVSQVLHLQLFRTTQISLLRHPLDARTNVYDTRYSIDDHIGIWLLAVTVGLGVLVGLLAAFRAVRRRDWPELACLVLLIAAVLLDFAYEVSYTVNLGGAVSRYILPALLPICLLISAGIRVVGRRLRAVALAVYLGLCYAMFSAWLLLESAHPGGKTPTKVPWALVVAVPVVLAVLLVVQVGCAAVLDRRRTEPAAVATPA